MTIAIMQPYFLPYLGYFQLIKAVDKFVIYDDVNFINRGWINRNNLLVGGQAHLFTVPLKEASQNKLIREIELAEGDAWRKKLLKTIQQAYQKAPNYSTVFPILEEIVHFNAQSIAELAVYALQKINFHLGISTEIISSSTYYQNSSLKAQERILDICRQEGAQTYINPIGGMELYNKSTFDEQKIQLYFIKSTLTPYPQFKNAFVPWLSIVDVLMFNERAAIHQLLTAYELI
ncbi:WbqC family protein [Rhabdobacter roseus]|uniref:WbqC family protein n=1 Tax=Rhabdobacter roseus TaxID=1655419 RepID=A0A840TTW3_9BACT|nr:WbqC family protein [Rhabdobacter roseus]MBB5283478.1 hypothetical protein [Rhabdobacter roseus]